MDYQRACACHNVRAGNRGTVSMPRRQEARYPEPGRCCTPPEEYPPNSFCYPSLAMGYFPYQKWDCLYEPAEALRNATLFKELNKPFLAGCKGGYAR